MPRRNSARRVTVPENREQHIPSYAASLPRAFADRKSYVKYHLKNTLRMRVANVPLEEGRRKRRLAHVGRLDAARCTACSIFFNNARRLALAERLETSRRKQS